MHALLQMLHNVLAELEAEPETAKSYVLLAHHLMHQSFVEHSNADIRIWNACAIADLCRLLAPETPFGEPQELQVLFCFCNEKLAHSSFRMRSFLCVVSCAGSTIQKRRTSWLTIIYSRFAPNLSRIPVANCYLAESQSRQYTQLGERTATRHGTKRAATVIQTRVRRAVSDTSPPRCVEPPAHCVRSY